MAKQVFTKVIKVIRIFDWFIRAGITGLLRFTLWYAIIQNTQISTHINTLALPGPKHVITTIEKRFDIGSFYSGLIAGSVEIGGASAAVFVSYFGSARHIPGWIGLGALLTGFGALLTIAICITQQPHHYHLNRINTNSLTNSSHNYYNNHHLQLQHHNPSHPFDTRYAPSISVGAYYPKPDDFPDGPPCSDKSADNYRYVLILIVAQLMIGIGGSPLYTLGTTYIDNHVSTRKAPTYIAFIYACGVFGPILGYGLGALMLLYYVDLLRYDTTTLNLTPSNSKWVGAWWGGFMLIGALLLLVSVPFYTFPKILVKEIRQLAREDRQKFFSLCDVFTASREHHQQQQQQQQQQHSNTKLLEGDVNNKNNNNSNNNNNNNDDNANSSNNNNNNNNNNKAGGNGVGAESGKLCRRQNCLPVYHLTFKLSFHKSCSIQTSTPDDAHFLCTHKHRIIRACLLVSDRQHSKQIFHLPCTKLSATQSTWSPVWGSVAKCPSSVASYSFCPSGVAVPGAVIGILMGGHCLRHCQLTSRGATQLVLALNSIALAGFGLFFVLGCSNLKIAGITVSYDNYSHYNDLNNYIPLSSNPFFTNNNNVHNNIHNNTNNNNNNYYNKFNLTSMCNKNCNCDDNSMEFVCGDNGVIYFSPCYAGCVTAAVGNGGKEQNYSDCSCVILPSSLSSSPQSPTTGSVHLTSLAEAGMGECVGKCETLVPFMVMLFFMTFVVTGTQMPLVMVTIRSVCEQEKALALGVQYVMLRLLAYIPAPLIYGSQIDQTCVHWARVCEVEGNCLVYDLACASCINSSPQCFTLPTG
ncbi:hypothetical protein HELRODRAFT_172826 [Helobdella robusta]|uniref:Kazal-like domain-containing protein n=1 Tax=Helobdella robusta TaxID=6412 RepID=T1F5Z4_HELRO|nr:hypothetical protein HELRODRAFT_172826 [Helobdella robusta]ESO04434.1 hypothetical protein HELRODRAFT_172826 [Helobdella robusta]